MEIALKLSVVFFDKGFSNYSTEDICDIAGKSKATIYKYFSSKEDMISLITSHKMEEIKQFASFLSNKDLKYQDRYKEAIELAVNAFGGISYSYLTDLKNEFPEIFAQLINLKNFSIQLLEDFYQKGIESGEFRKINPTLLAANDDLFFTAILETDFLSDKNFSIQQVFETYFNSRFQGILNLN